MPARAPQSFPDACAAPLVFDAWLFPENAQFFALDAVKDVYLDLVDKIMATSGYQDIMTNLMSTLKLNTVQVDFTATDTTTLQNYVVDVLSKMSSTGWDSLRESFPALTDSIDSTYGVVSHVNNFIGLNISDTPFQIIKAAFAGGSILMAVLALLIPVISYLTQVLNIKLMPTAATAGGDNDQMAQQMKMMNRTMPLFSLVMCFTVPVGLGIYWIASAVFRTIIYLFIDKFFNTKSVDDIIEANKEKAAKKAEKRGEQNAKLEEYAAMKTKNIDRRSISQIANAGKGNGDAKAEKKSESSNAGGKSSKKVDKNNAEADKKSISGYAHMLNRHDD